MGVPIADAAYCILTPENVQEVVSVAFKDHEGPLCRVYVSQQELDLFENEYLPLCAERAGYTLQDGLLAGAGSAGTVETIPRAQAPISSDVKDGDRKAQASKQRAAQPDF